MRTVMTIGFETKMNKLGLSLITAVAMTNAAVAEDCGEPPLDQPSVPELAQSAEEIRAARDAVLAYSGTVDQYIECMDKRMVKFGPYMTKEQIARRQDDLNDLHNSRRDLQLSLNDAIRAYRRETRGR